MVKIPPDSSLAAFFGSEPDINEDATRIFDFRSPEGSYLLVGLNPHVFSLDITLRFSNGEEVSVSEEAAEGLVNTLYGKLCAELWERGYRTRVVLQLSPLTLECSTMRIWE
ncbi:MAG TPA: hypothetical protein VFL36_10375 [Myxococcales bacterium]|nr:hypothetical protein [Myxococcales bacterium]